MYNNFKSLKIIKNKVLILTTFIISVALASIADFAQTHKLGADINSTGNGSPNYFAQMDILLLFRTSDGISGTSGINDINQSGGSLEMNAYTDILNSIKINQ